MVNKMTEGKGKYLFVLFVIFIMMNMSSCPQRSSSPPPNSFSNLSCPPPKGLTECAKGYICASSTEERAYSEDEGKENARKNALERLLFEIILHEKRETIRRCIYSKLNLEQIMYNQYPCCKNEDGTYYRCSAKAYVRKKYAQTLRYIRNTCNCRVTRPEWLSDCYSGLDRNTYICASSEIVKNVKRENESEQSARESAKINLFNIAFPDIKDNQIRKCILNKLKNEIRYDQQCCSINDRPYECYARAYIKKDEQQFEDIKRQCTPECFNQRPEWLSDCSKNLNARKIICASAMEEGVSQEEGQNRAQQMADENLIKKIIPEVNGKQLNCTRCSWNILPINHDLAPCCQKSDGMYQCYARAYVARSQQRAIKNLAHQCERRSRIVNCLGENIDLCNFPSAVAGIRANEDEWRCIRRFITPEPRECHFDGVYYISTLTRPDFVSDLSTFFSGFLRPRIYLEKNQEVWNVETEGNFTEQDCEYMLLLQRALASDDLNSFLSILEEVKVENIPYWLTDEMERRIYNKFQQLTPEMWRMCGNGENVFTRFYDNLSRILGEKYAQNWNLYTGRDGLLSTVTYNYQQGDFKSCINEVEPHLTKLENCVITPEVYIYMIKCLKKLNKEEEANEIEQRLKNVGINPDQFCTFYSQP